MIWLDTDKDRFRSTRLEALVLLGGYDIAETTEQIRERLTRYYERSKPPLSADSEKGKV